MSVGTGIVLDILFLVVVLLAIRNCARRGFVRTVVELVGWLVLVYAAFKLATPLAQQLYDRFLHESVSKAILERVQSAMQDTAAQTSQSLWSSLPGFVRAGFNMTQSGLEQTVADNISGGAEQICQMLMQSVITPALLLILRCVLIALIFALGTLLVRTVAISLNKLFSLPIVGSLNRTLGGVVGAVKGMILVLMLCVLLSLILTLIPEGLGPVNLEMLESSYTYRFISGMDTFALSF